MEGILQTVNLDPIQHGGIGIVITHQIDQAIIALNEAERDSLLHDLAAPTRQLEHNYLIGQMQSRFMEASMDAGVSPAALHSQRLQMMTACGVLQTLNRHGTLKKEGKWAETFMPATEGESDDLATSAIVESES